jgi:hypothetical protein
MNNLECEYFAAIISATKTNQWTDALRNHAATCSRCKETMAMTTMMKELIAEDRPHPLPNYHTIWLKARYARKQERLTKFDLFALVGVSLSGIVGLVGLLFWIFPQVFGKLVAIPVISGLQLTNVFSFGTPTFILAGLVVTVWLLTRDSIFAER